MPYIERDESGAIVCLYNALDPVFQQARNYLSTGKLQERLGEYPAVHAEAARLGLSFDAAVTDICSRWPEWIEEADLSSPAPSGVFDSEGPDNAADDAGQAEMGDSVDADFVDSGDIGGVPEADFDAGPGDPDYSVSEPVGDMAAVADEPEAAPVTYPGMMISGDALASAKAFRSFEVNAIERELVGSYDAMATRQRIVHLRNRDMGAVQYGWTPLSDDEKAELQALDTFDGHISAIRENAVRLRDTIELADSLEAVNAVDLQSGWPE